MVSQMSEYNILILSAGRRVELVNQFKEAIKNLNVTGNIIAADSNQLSAALFFADTKYIIPKIGDSNYIDSILDICERESIKLVVPTIDTELPILSLNKDYIYDKTGSRVLISEQKVIDICTNKEFTSLFFEKHKFHSPRVFTEEELRQQKYKLPLFIKPKSGSSSINAFKVETVSELKNYKKIVPNYLIQEFIEGDEYSIDAFLDFQSNIITVVPRLRISTRSGEISKGKIVKDRKIINEVIKLLQILKPIGQITIQLIKNNDNLYFIEINPRFGGGTPMSIFSGANSCENIIKLLMNQKLSYNEDYIDNQIFLRYDAAVMIREDKEHV